MAKGRATAQDVIVRMGEGKSSKLYDTRNFFEEATSAMTFLVQHN
jgi:hypothetical protein